MDKKPIALGYTSQIASSGEMERFPDSYKNVTQEDVKDATDLEHSIIRLKSAIEGGYYQMAKFLDEFEKRNLHLARGYPTFRAWCGSPEIDIQYRLVHDMLRLVREAAPMLAEDALAHVGISKARALLPLLTDGDIDLAAALEETQGLSVRDTVEYVKEKRGIAQPIDAETPAIFTATIRRGDSYHTVTVRRTGDDPYPCGTLRIKPSDWPRWEARFGDFVQVSLDSE